MGKNLFKLHEDDNAKEIRKRVLSLIGAIMLAVICCGSAYYYVNSVEKSSNVESVKVKEVVTSAVYRDLKVDDYLELKVHYEAFNKRNWIYKKPKPKEKIKFETVKREVIVEKPKVIPVKEKKVQEKVVSRNDNNTVDSVVYSATSYTAYCKGCSGITAMGHDARKSIYYQGYRVIAVDPKFIPLNSIVEISYGNVTFKAIALDTGGAIKGYKIDILEDSYNDAIDFGRRNVSLRILKSGK